MTDISKASASSRIMRQQAIQKGKQYRREANQIAKAKASEEYEETGFNQVAIQKNFKTLQEQRKRHISKAQNADDEVQVIEETAKAEEAATRFNKRNFELKIKTLLLLRDTIADDDTVEDILRKVLDFYPDYTLADEALDFLLETTLGPLNTRVLQAKEFLNANYKREIVAGRNINLQAQIFSKEGMGTPTFLRDMYREITGNPVSPHELFDQLTSKFSYDSMKMVIRFLLHSLGSDLKSKGPSISKGELIRLMDETQILQAISGLYRFFRSRQNLISSQFEHFGLIQPNILNFEILSKQFMSLLKERYISSDKILMLSRLLGISEELAAQIIIYTQMRDATRYTSQRLYKSEKHRQEVLAAIIESLEELEEKLEEEEE
ncbi:MAG: hypothetical protein JXA94_06715 [Parachlamydiales bacterium]|nr:hypothetical protein [Parachlamydiales bacterium]